MVSSGSGLMINTRDDVNDELIADNVFEALPGRTLGITASASYNYAFGNRSIGNMQYVVAGLGLTLINLGEM